MNNDKTDMLEEYDLADKKSIRGKYYDHYNKGFAVRIFGKNGDVKEQYFVAIENDVHERFPDSEAVNKALRGLIS